MKMEETNTDSKMNVYIEFPGYIFKVSGPSYGVLALFKRFEEVMLRTAADRAEHAERLRSASK